jgi:hypothetical protein
MAIIHYPEKETTQYNKDIPPHTASYVNLTETVSYFSVHWQKNISGDDQFPSLANDCGNGTCQLTDDDTCLCNTEVSESIVFNSSPPSREAILTNLKIGAFHPDTFNDGAYEQFAIFSDIFGYKLAGGDDYTTDTIFEVTSEYDSDEKIYLKNVKAEVTVRSLVDGLSIASV